MKYYLISLLIISMFLGCKQSQVRSIDIGSTLYSNQTYLQNKELVKLISKTLEKKPEALNKLLEFNCGGGSGCYDLGEIFTQLVYEIGEEDFIKMITEFNSIQISTLEGYLKVGFEYGSYNEKTVKTEFPKLYNELITIDKSSNKG